MSASQCERVLAVLKDGRPHTMEEIHEHAGFMRPNSRVSDLRHRGYNIRCDRRDGHYVYQLVALDEPTVAAIGKRKRAVGSSSVPASDPPSRLKGEHPPASGTLLLFDCDVDESAGLRGAYWDDAA